MEFKVGENGPYFSCDVPMCDFWGRDSEELKKHETDVHGRTEEEAEEIVREWEEFEEEYSDSEEASREDEDAQSFFDGNRFVARDLARDIMSDYAFATMRDSEEIYHYQNGRYRDNGETVIKEEAQRRLQEFSKAHYKNETVDYIRAETYVDREEFNTEPMKISVRNGVLNLRTRELEPHSPDYLTTIQLPVEYDSEADCPKIQEFLKDVLHEDDIPLVQGFVGYCLLKDYRFHKALMLVGDGANGKSTFLNLVKSLLGNENISTPSLHDLLKNRFAKADLYGKLANIHADIPAKKLGYTGVFKMLTGQDRIRGEKKHKDAFDFDNFAKLMFSANQIPETKDDSRAFYRRWIIINFIYTFCENPSGEFEKKKNPQILDEITSDEELSGFLNWALDGLNRLLENGEFSTRMSIEERAELWEKMSSPIVAFIDESLEKDADAETPKDVVYRAYKEFCQDKNSPALDKNVFSRKLKKKADVEFTRPKIRGERTQCYKGVRLSGETEESHSDTVEGLEEFDGSIDELS